jgi:hypothetical protein
MNDIEKKKYRTNDASIKRSVKVKLLTRMHAQKLDP